MVSRLAFFDECETFVLHKDNIEVCHSQRGYRNVLLMSLEFTSLCLQYCPTELLRDVIQFLQCEVTSWNLFPLCIDLQKGYKQGVMFHPEALLVLLWDGKCSQSDVLNYLSSNDFWTIDFSSPLHSIMLLFTFVETELLKCQRTS